MALSNHDLEQLAAKNGITINGIYVLDQIPKVMKNGFYVYNMDNTLSDGSNGTHWICTLSDNNDCVYFDSFGQPPPLQIIKFISQTHDCYYYNNRQLQNLDAVSCGKWCIAVAVFVANAKTNMSSAHNLLRVVNHFISQFKDSTKHNEVIIKKVL